tara:strand:+ start:22671 stop:23411 length:741 start_codon:yes stop_codon:yes gene_type:complete
MFDSLILFAVVLVVCAFIYSSVGHGGASAYLALMALFSFDTVVMKQTALSLNLVVAAISFFQFYRLGFFKLKLFLFLAMTSVPASFLGGMLTLESTMYKIILGLFLLLAVARILFKPSQKELQIEEEKFNVLVALVIGASIGFVSGLIGIGGGIILSPLLLLLKWADVKNTAGISALFIWVNSAAGLSGQLQSGIQIDDHLFLFMAVVALGAILGGYWGSKSLSFINLEKVIAVVLIAAAVKLIAF